MAGPYRELYIYHLEGRLAPEAWSGCGSFLGLWPEGESGFMFFSSPEPEEVQAFLRRQPGARLAGSYRMPYDQWQGAPLCGERIGRFWIAPPWESEAAPAAGGGPGLRLLLDPGVVFGAGSHPTTRDCLKALELAVAAGAAESAIDLGTGTGILAVAAALLGCRRVLAVDLNPLAARTALANVRLNGLAGRILVAQARAEDCLPRPAGLAIANIHAEVMLRLLQAGGFRGAERLVLSGLMRSEAKEVRRLLALERLEVAAEWIAEGVWQTFYAVRR
jgi:ribosomal protein L11 methyltransferase